jgi:hypothetical protein
MSIEISHAINNHLYVIKEYSMGMRYRYILLNDDEMKRLSKLLKHEGF